ADNAVALAQSLQKQIADIGLAPFWKGPLNVFMKFSDSFDFFSPNSFSTPGWDSPTIFFGPTTSQVPRSFVLSELAADPVAGDLELVRRFVPPRFSPTPPDSFGDLSSVAIRNDK